MEVVIASSLPPPLHRQPISKRIPIKLFQNPIFHHIPSNHKSNSKTLASISPPAAQIPLPPEKFEWHEHWYPVFPVCDLDKGRPHGRRVIGIDVVAWWDRNENAWKVFEDLCPHRLAPLSEGRIDQWGRLQCVYHGWCFGGGGECKFIPQAPRRRRQARGSHASRRARVGVYPSCVQNGILWFWPNSDEEYKEIYSIKKPHYIPQLDDPSFANTIMTSRDMPYGYEVLIENLMDPAHVSYAHHGIMTTATVGDSDREGGIPLEMRVEKVDVNGFTSKQVSGNNYFIAPCLYYAYFSPGGGARPKTSSEVVLPRVPDNKTAMLVFLCIPVSPGRSRLIYAVPRNFDVWVDRVVPRWVYHMGQNLILDSDLFLLHLEERKLKDVGAVNWHKSCYIPTKSDALIVAFRRWLNKYGGTQVDWRDKYSGELPPTPPREQLFDRYWTHTVSCSSCSVAYKRLNALQFGLQLISIASTAIVAAAKKGAISIFARYSLASMAVLCFLASKWLSHFIYKNFHCHDYDHAFR